MSRLGRRALLGAAAAVAWPGVSSAEVGSRTAAAIAALPRAGLWTTAAPIQHAPTLARAIDLRAGLWLMRDDRAGTVVGGGKARKLDLLLGDAIASGAREVATTGGAGSNHARSVALAARALGLRCRLALLPEPATAEVTRNLATLTAAGAAWSVGGRDGVRRLEAEARASGGSIVWIPMGGTTPLGDLAFVAAALDLAAHVHAGHMPAPSAVVTALGSGGSAVGLALGLAVAGLPTRVVAVRCSSPGTSSRAVLDREMGAAWALLARHDPALPDVLADARRRLFVAPGELGGGYARPTAAGTRAAAMLRDLEGVEVDATYTAKAAAHLVRGPTSLREEPVVLCIACDARWLAAAALRPGSRPPPPRSPP